MEFRRGMITHPRDNVKLWKIIEPDESEVFMDGVKQSDIKLFIPINFNVKKHYILLDESYTNPLNNESFYLVRLITPSDNFLNSPIDPKWIIELKPGFSLKDSFVTLDKFAIHESDIKQENIVGQLLMTEI